ncbi:hypothetical protein SARC_05870 [Sphaeroforma arctica JP610]|uniref:Lecithin:cholesterol acyltransferase n=1 Tax=Sphaeroforma arctica JP610 TaxID=667725 RepID=A0A0L0G0V0_9EUKA|nr:hypothetical protein SARC_05870 [Sphaeroforma arctica JP610]KNC81833.1 hypothetical protein SARC_05870 [Sphaeroforma arctica JP610]|eukprot:XP_014155735.1 hypothetical protein SARC_05870 [Sphaeroforma arctica JP610]
MRQGDRLWININKLGGQGLFKKNNVSLIGDGVTLAEASAQQGNAWLRHMCLDHGVDDPPGIRVRPMEGIDAVDFLIPGALTGAASYVFSELIEQLRFVGYTNANLIAAPYDWRLAPSRLEEKTSYFTKLADKIEAFYEANGDTPVVLFGHSMGVMCTTYFLRFVERQRGNEWIQTHVHKFMAAGGPWLGAYKTIRSSVIGENFDLPFVNSSEALLMCRSMSSAPWLHPRGPCVENDFIYVREEGNFTLGPFIIRLCDSTKIPPNTSVYLKGKIGQTSVEGQAEAEDGTYVCKGRQMLRSQFPDGPLETEVLKFTLRVGKTAIGILPIIMYS